MTIKKTALRPRRSTGPESLPLELVAWFQGEQSSAPWCALLPGPGDADLLPARWAAWKAKHPNAVFPVGYEYLLEVTP